jgi:hypothetical protein
MRHPSRQTVKRRLPTPLLHFTIRGRSLRRQGGRQEYSRGRTRRSSPHWHCAMDWISVPRRSRSSPPHPGPHRRMPASGPIPTDRTDRPILVLTFLTENGGPVYRATDPDFPDKRRKLVKLSF